MQKAALACNRRGVSPVGTPVETPAGMHEDAYRSTQTRHRAVTEWRAVRAFCPFGIWEKIIPMRCLGRIALLFLLATSAASAQVKETIDVHLVEVPVTVVDRDGNPVRGLTAANFELFDQGTKRAIGNFDAIDFDSAGRVGPRRR